MRGFFRWYYWLATGLILGLLWLLQQVAVRIDFLNAFEQALADFTITDLAFRLREPAPVDPRVVLVNIGTLDRAGIAQQLNVLNHFKPRVVALDVNFQDSLNHQADSALEAALARTARLVLYSKVDSAVAQPNGQVVWHQLHQVLPRFARHGRSGFANALTPGEGPFETWRETSASERLASGATELSLATQIARQYDSARANAFLTRQRDFEIINFKGNDLQFTRLDVQDVLDTNFMREVVQDKILIMCYLGGSYVDQTWDYDKFYTPLNPQQIGRTPPDMFGGVVHANIVSMILDARFINPSPNWLNLLVAVAVTLFNVRFFARIHHSRRWGLWYNLVSKLFQLVELLLINFVVIYLFARFNWSMDLTVTVFAVVLSGDVFEIYATFMRNWFGVGRPRERGR
ncbi:MAG: CHASE2 domain-containing protein [Bernardetiaceae bacterium]|nr:CHASE2 domain-containing protein [Bernardetiaceae bacterium]